MLKRITWCGAVLAAGLPAVAAKAPAARPADGRAVVACNPSATNAAAFSAGCASGAAQDTPGKAIFTGKGNCYVCHGPDAKGTPLAPDLTDTTWLNIDGSLAAIEKTIRTGVARPKQKEHSTPMPAMGGAQLTDAEIQTVARYVYSLSHPK